MLPGKIQKRRKSQLESLREKMTRMLPQSSYIVNNQNLRSKLFIGEHANIAHPGLSRHVATEYKLYSPDEMLSLHFKTQKTLKKYPSCQQFLKKMREDKTREQPNISETEMKRYTYICSILGGFLDFSKSQNGKPYTSWTQFYHNEVEGNNPAGNSCGLMHFKPNMNSVSSLDMNNPNPISNKVGSSTKKSVNKSKKINCNNTVSGYVHKDKEYTKISKESDSKQNQSRKETCNSSRRNKAVERKSSKSDSVSSVNTNSCVINKVRVIINKKSGKSEKNEENIGNNFSSDILESNSSNSSEKSVNASAVVDCIVISSEDEVDVNSLCEKESFYDMPNYSPDMSASEGILTETWDFRKWLCGICRKDMLSQNSLETTICGHVFCRTCIGQSLKKDGHCPTCSNKLSESDTHPIYINLCI